MKKLIYVVLLTIPFTLLGQSDSCAQYQKIIEYFKADSSFTSYYKGVNMKFRISQKVSSGGVLPFMTYDYIAGKLGLTKEELVFNRDTSILFPMLRKLKKEENSDTTEYRLTCLSNLGVNKKARINIDFCRKDSDVLVVYTERIYRKPIRTYGMIHLFFFDERNNIIQVFDSTWIE